MPLAALGARPLARAVADARARAAAGAILVAGGLAGLGLLPRALIVATFPSQVLVGVGLTLVLSALTETALEGKAPQAIHGGWTIAARHAGVVAGLLVLTPVFTADLVTERRAAEQAGTAALLDADLPALFKIDLAQRLAVQLSADDGRVPAIGPAFDPLPDDPGERGEALRLKSHAPGRSRSRSDPRVQRLVPDRRRLRPRGAPADRPRAQEGQPVKPRVLLVGAVIASLALVLTSLALGGASYEPTPVQDPCRPRPWRAPESVDEIAQQLTLSALDGAACELHVSRETLVLALGTAEGRSRFANDPRLAAALRAGLIRAIDDAERAGAIPGIVADGLRAAARGLPADQLIAAVMDAADLFDQARGALGPLGDLLGGLP